MLGVEVDVAGVRRSIADRRDMTCIRIDGDEFVILACGERVDGGRCRWRDLPGRCRAQVAMML